MSSGIVQRITRLERAAGGRNEMVGVDFSDEDREILRAALASYGLPPQEIEAQVARRWHEPCHLVARLGPVEREQRLLAIRERVADHPAARAFLDAALQRS